MVKCAKCLVEFDSKECLLTCVECKNTFHPACTRARSDQNLTKQKIKSWKCDTCRADTASTTSNEEPEDRRTILEALKIMKKEIIANTDDKFEAMHDLISSMTEEIKELKYKVVAVEGKQTELAERCVILEKNNHELSEEVQELRLRLLDSEQHSRSVNLEIQGLPRTTGEDIYEALRHLAISIGVTYKREDISIAHRLRLFSKKHVHPPLIVQFVSRSTREEWLYAARRMKGLNTTQLSPTLQPGPIYVNEHLTSHNKELLGYARRLMRERKLHYAGYHNGKILVKRRDGEEATRVSSRKDLEKFEI